MGLPHSGLRSRVVAGARPRGRGSRERHYPPEGLIRRALSISSVITATASIAGAPDQDNSGAATGAALTLVWIVYAGSCSVTVVGGGSLHVVATYPAPPLLADVRSARG